MEESMAQPARKSNIPLIVGAALVVACLCGCVTLTLTVGTGFFFLNQASAPVQPIYVEPIQPVDPFEAIGTPEIFDPNLPVGGYTDNKLRGKVWDFILPMAERDADCENPTPMATMIEVTVEPDASGVWEEHWTLVCGNGPMPVFRIIFTPNPGGIINFSPGLISK
ncbi:MAG: hypothetical protein ACOY0R_20960 [Chloroflexota bacterium]